MAITSVILADVSTLTVGSTVIEAAQSFQASRSADTRPIYTFNRSKPVLIVSVPTTGNGSFAYIASDGTGSSAVQDWSTLITGNTSISCAGNTYPSGGSAQTISLTACSFGGQSESMNVRGELQVTVNFLFASGTF